MMRCTLARDDIPLLSQWIKNRQVETCRFLCKDYKKDIFAVFAYDFEPSHNFQVLEKSMFYASFPTIAPGLGGSDFTALLRAFGDREI